jgi:hypothetical protein
MNRIKAHTKVVSANGTTYFVEFKDNKGFRIVSQGPNAKNPNRGAYSDIIVMNVNGKGDVNFEWFNLNNTIEKKNEVCKFLAENFELFTTEQIKAISAKLFAMMKIEIESKVRYKGANTKIIMDLYTPALKIALKGFTSGENVFGEFKLDVDAIKALEVKEYNPF